MLKRMLLSICVFMLLAVAGNVGAAEFQSIGYQAISMGGAGVASSKGSYAPYYNPALLAKPRYGGEVTLGVGVGAREINLVDHIDELSRVDIDATFNELATLDYTTGPGGEIIVNTDTVRADVSTIKKELGALSTRNGLQLMPTLSLGVQAGKIGVGVFGMSESTAAAVIDENRLDVIYYETSLGEYLEYDEVADEVTVTTEDEYNARSIEYAINNETTYLDLTGIGYAEVPIAYGHQFNLPVGTLCVGGSFKIMPGNTYAAKVKIDTASEDISDELRDSEKSDVTWGVDLGLLYNLPDMNELSFGLVCKNLNSPEYKTVFGNKLGIDPQVRAGVAWNFLNDKLTLAIDMDLTTNESFIANYDTQNLGGGISFQPVSWFSIRGGVMENLKESDVGTILTAGMGLGTKWIQLDLAGQYATEKGEFDGEEIPRYSRVQLAFVSRWN